MFLKKHAFTMIELVFAIVIIGISVAAIPTMINTGIKNQEQSLVSEGIFALSSMVLQDSTYYWDAASKDPLLLHSNVLDLTNCTPPECNINSKRVAGTIYRVGHTSEISSTTHRHFYTTDPTTELNTSANESIETRKQTTETSILTKSGALGYKQSFKYTMSISYVADDTLSTTSLTQPTNTKMLEYKLYKVNSDASTTQVALMRNFVSNIGETYYAKRSF